jgi:putative FmdB family regulatory protein
VIYTFRCRNCRRAVQVEHRISEPHPTRCPACAGDLQRVFDPLPVHYRDSGFYATDKVLYDPIKPEDYNPDEDV